jgi:hypothetical protein
MQIFQRNYSLTSTRRCKDTARKGEDGQSLHTVKVGDTLLCANQPHNRLSSPEAVSGATFGSLSPAEQAILSGRPVQGLDPNGRLENLLTPEAIKILFSTKKNTRKEVRDKIIAAIKREIEGPLCFRYVTRYQIEFLKARHSIAERQATRETNTSHPSTTIVTVDGSYKVTT